MRICHISTFWPTTGGHTHYTDNLIGGMRAHERSRHIVVAEHTAAPVDSEAVRCIPCFDRHTDYGEKVATTAAEAQADVAIIQYSNDVFGDDERFPRMLAQLRERGIRSIINAHSVYPPRWRSHHSPGHTIEAFDLACAAQATAFTVHSPRMRRDLLARGVDPAQVFVIPHGSRALPQRDVRASRRELGIPEDAKVVLFFGFVWLGKGLSFLVDVFADLRKQVPEAYLYIGGHTRRRLWSFYMSYLRTRARLQGAGDRMKLWGAYVPDDMVATVYSSADVVAMPYRQDYSSVSGVVHQTAGMGKLMLCSRIAKFDEVEASIDPALTIDPHDRRAWVDMLVRLLTDEVLAASMRQKIQAFAEATSWENVGRQHLALCRQLVEKTNAHSR